MDRRRFLKLVGVTALSPLAFMGGNVSETGFSKVVLQRAKENINAFAIKPIMIEGKKYYVIIAYPSFVKALEFTAFEFLDN